MLVENAIAQSVGDDFVGQTTVMVIVAIGERCFGASSDFRKRWVQRNDG